MSYVCGYSEYAECPEYNDMRCCKQCEKRESCTNTAPSCKCDDVECEYMKQEEDS